MAIAGLFLVAAGGCGAAAEAEDVRSADALWARLQAASYRGWDRPPGFASRRVSDLPPDPAAGGRPLLVDIYLNDVVGDALARRAPLGAWPEGSIFVKDGFLGDELAVVAAMERRASRWYFAQWSPGGDPQLVGSPGECVPCHERGQDQVRSVPLPGAL